MRSESARRTPLRAAALLALLCGASPVPAQAPAGADAQAPDDSGHGVRGTAIPVLELDSEEDERRYQRLLRKLICNCEKENWTRTLANCRDGCADPQKNLIRERIRAGWDDLRIIDEQVAIAGTPVLANPGWSGTGKWLFILPAVALVAGAWIAGVAIRRSQEAGRAAREIRRERHGSLAPEEIARIERDLEKIE